MKKEDAFYMCPLFCLQRRKGSFKGEKTKPKSGIRACSDFVYC